MADRSRSVPSEQVPNAGISGAVVAIARAMQVHAALPQAYSMISRIAVSTILGCEHAALSVVRRRPTRHGRQTDMLPTAVDALRYECGQGPSLDVRTRRARHLPHP